MAPQHYDFYSTLSLNREHSCNELAAELDSRREQLAQQGVAQHDGRIQEIVTARAILGNEHHRKLYDDRLSNPSAPTMNISSLRYLAHQGEFPETRGDIPSGAPSSPTSPAFSPASQQHYAATAPAYPQQPPLLQRILPPTKDMPKETRIVVISLLSGFGLSILAMVVAFVIGIISAIKFDGAIEQSKEIFTSDTDDFLGFLSEFNSAIDAISQIFAHGGLLIELLSALVGLLALAFAFLFLAWATCYANKPGVALLITLATFTLTLFTFFIGVIYFRFWMIPVLMLVFFLPALIATIYSLRTPTRIWFDPNYRPRQTYSSYQPQEVQGFHGAQKAPQFPQVPPQPSQSQQPESPEQNNYWNNQN